MESLSLLLFSPRSSCISSVNESERALKKTSLFTFVLRPSPPLPPCVEDQPPLPPSSRYRFELDTPWSKCSQHSLPFITSQFTHKHVEKENLQHQQNQHRFPFAPTPLPRSDLLPFACPLKTHRLTCHQCSTSLHQFHWKKERRLKWSS